jgi:ADP-ribose pyrophosphatase YjhB (NUDIX family)
LQVAALPFVYEANKLKVLLITNRKKEKWLIPKGWPVKKLTFPDSAACEAHEEAGVKGVIYRESFGQFGYDKKIKKEQTIPCRVIVYGLCVTDQSSEWEEKGQRTLLWCSLEEAAKKVSHGNLAKLLKKLICDPSLLPSSSNL